MTDRAKRIIKKMVLLVATVIGLYAGIQYLRTTSPLFNFFFRPSDFGKQLACAEFDLSNIGKYELNFQNKYPGNHWISVLVENPTRIGDSYLTDFKLNIKIMDSDKVIIDKETTKADFPFWGGKENSGFAIFTYKVPSDLKRGKPLRATVQIEVPDEKFTATYGKQKLCIQKFSDE